MDIKTAQRFLARVLLNFKDTDELFSKAGIFRLAKASLIEDDTFHHAFRQRVPKEAGSVYAEYLEKAKELAEWEDDMLKRLQDHIIVKIQELSAAGSIASRYANMQLELYYPVEAEQEQ